MATNTAAAARESRRRKILEKGADRLALITGRTQTVPSESSDKPNADSSQQLNSQLQLQDPPPPLYLSDQITASTNGGYEGSSSRLLNNDPTIDADQSANNLESPYHTDKTGIETSRASASDGSSNEQLPLPLSTNQKSTMSISGTMQNLGPQTRPNRVLTPSQISSAIAASERYRFFCSVTVAALVVFSYLGFPLLGSNIIKSIISFRPLYLVLLTNLTLVLVLLLYNNQRGFERNVGGEYNIPSTSQNDWAEQAGKALEVGLLIQKAVEAVIMDCSVYVIIIIIGLSFVQ